MTNYENDIVNLCPGSTPREKYENLKKLIKIKELDNLKREDLDVLDIIIHDTGSGHTTAQTVIEELRDFRQRLTRYKDNKEVEVSDKEIVIEMDGERYAVSEEISFTGMRVGVLTPINTPNKVVEDRVNGIEAELSGTIYDQRKEIERLKQRENDWIKAFGDFCQVINKQIKKSGIK